MTMRKLIDGIVEFRKQLTPENRELFAKLSLGQKPDALFIACCDSRVVPNLFASTNPGDLFVVRNIGNLMPPSSALLHDASGPAALEFSLSTLKVSNIIVCGHSECGAMEALVDGIDTICCPHLKSWLKYAEPSLEKTRSGHIVNPSLSLYNQVSQTNVLQQVEHIKSYTAVQEKLQEKKMQIHAWWFDIAKADVYCYEESLHQFILIDEKEAEVILARLK
jgi:carbonic anhydrase